MSDAETIGYASDISDAKTIQYAKPYRDPGLNNQYRLKAKKIAIKTLRKKRTEPGLKVTNAVKPPSPEVKITRVIPKITPDANYKKWVNDVVFKGISHPKSRQKIKERRLARGNSAAVKADFAIDPEDYIDKPLVFDIKTTSEDEIFDWLVTNMANDNGI